MEIVQIKAAVDAAHAEKVKKAKKQRANKTARVANQSIAGVPDTFLNAWAID